MVLFESEYLKTVHFRNKFSLQEGTVPAHSPTVWVGLPEIGSLFLVVVSMVSAAQLVTRRNHDRKAVGSIPTNAVCFTVVR